MHTGVFWEAIYGLSSVVLAIVAIILFVRGFHRSLPVFSIYIVALVLVDVARAIAYHGPLITYYYVYWISDAVSTLFALLAAGELFFRRLFPQFYKLRFYRYLFLFALIVIAVFTAMTAYSSRPALLLSTLITVLHTSDFLLTAILLFVVGLMVFMGRRWGQYEFGIALGLGINAIALLTTFAIFSKFLPVHGVLRELPVFSEDASSLIWLITFARPEKATRVIQEPLSPEILEEAEQWKKTLKRSWTGKKRNQWPP